MDPKRKLKAVEDLLSKTADEIEQVWAKAREEQRDSTDDERQDISEKLKSIESLKQQKRELEEEIELRKSVTQIAGQLRPDDEPRVTRDREDRIIAELSKTPGEIFVQSAGFKSMQEAYKESGRLREGATSGAVMIQAKGTLLEGAGGGGGALSSTVPQVIPGVVEKQFQPLSVADLLLSGQTATTSLRYVVEGTATSGAAGVAEGGTKPESTLGLTTTDEPVKKIATVLPISEEMLEDAPAVQSYINGRLTLFVRIEEERQLLRGAGTNEIVGIMPSGNTRGINIYAGGTAAGSKAEQLFKAMNGQRGSALVEPSFIVLSPGDWQDIRLAKDTANQYYGGGPFLGPYGGPQGPVGTGNQLNAGVMDSIWNKPVIVTSALGSGTALIGTTSAAQVWRRSGISVEATNSHSDYFVKNLVAIRAEERLALAVYRPTAFTEVRLS